MKGTLNESKIALEESELVVNTDGSIFHLHLLPHQIADTILIVGDQGRVKQISQHFSKIEHIVENREFVTHTGIYKGKRITALSTGIGADNIDIVINELDSLVNIDLKTRKIKAKKKIIKHHKNWNLWSITARYSCRLLCCL